jgi:hypothetical protein
LPTISITLLGGILAHSELALTEFADGSNPAEELQKIRAAVIVQVSVSKHVKVETKFGKNGLLVRASPT